MGRPRQPAHRERVVEDLPERIPAAIASRERVLPLDVDGYLASIENCRARFPKRRILSGIEAGEPHHFEGSVAAVLKRGQFDCELGSLHSIVHDERLVYTDRVFG